MKHFAVIGFPIGHSLSPLMHNTAFKKLNLDYNYTAIEIEPTKLKNHVQEFRKEDWIGINVTVPHKETIMPLLDEISEQAKVIGAVNTIVNKNGRLIGYNTDVIGIEKSLIKYKNQIFQKDVVILGSGGAARSVASVLVHQLKPKSITFAAQFPEQAEALINYLGSTNVELIIAPYTNDNLEKALAKSLLIINATTVGMHPNNNHSPIPNSNWINASHIVFDCVYRPLKTKLLKDAQEKGAKTIDGLEMFIQQGAASFNIWTGLDMPIDIIRQTLENKLAE